jgi:hypothetical protein
LIGSGCRRQATARFIATEPATARCSRLSPTTGHLPHAHARAIVDDPLALNGSVSRSAARPLPGLAGATSVCGAAPLPA